MSTATRQAEPAAIADEAIAEYLRAHPDFFERNLGLLATLRLPHHTTGGAISLVERQLEVLRQRNLAMESRLKELLEVAHGNDRLAARIHSLALQLMRARSREAVIDSLDEQLRDGFAVDEAGLILFDSVPGLLQGHSSFIRVMHREDPVLGPFKSFLQGSTPRCSRPREAQRDFLFGQGSHIQSMALVPLGPHSEFGFLAIGSRDPGHFHPGQSIDFLARLGELTACALSLH